MRLVSHVEVAGHQRRTTNLVSPSLVVQLIDNRGVTVETEPIARAFPELWGGSYSSLTILLDGCYESDVAGSVEAGAAVHECRESWRERWTGPRQRFIAIGWRGAPGPRVGHARLGPAARAAWTEIALMLDRSRPPADLAERIEAASRSAGIDIPRARLAVPPEVHRLEGPLCRAHTSLHQDPQSVDLERWSGLSARQIRRILAEHRTWVRGVGLREALHQQRIKAALCLLQCAGLESERIARALGYGSNRALYTALRRVGLGAGA